MGGRVPILRNTILDVATSPLSFQGLPLGPRVQHIQAGDGGTQDPTHEGYGIHTSLIASTTHRFPGRSAPRRGAMLRIEARRAGIITGWNERRD